MPSPAPKLCEDCAHHCFATSNNRTTCAKRRGQRYVWPEKLGDAHGPAPLHGMCFEARGGSLVAEACGHVPTERAAA